MTAALNAWELAAAWWRDPWALQEGQDDPILDCLMATDARAGLFDDELRAQRCDIYGAFQRTIDRCAEKRPTP